MGGGNRETPRQKLISLMYLVFIAMLAMNVSKEVLNGFGLINQRIQDTNKAYIKKNNSMIESLKLKSEESPDLFKKPYDQANKILVESKKLYNFLEAIKTDIKKQVSDTLSFESMDKSDYLDEKMYAGSPFRKSFLDNIRNYKEKMIEIISENESKHFGTISNRLNSYFDVDTTIKDKEGVPVPFLDYYLIGFPMISQLTKLTQIQNDILNVVSELFSTLLSGKLSEIASFNNYTTLLELERSVVFSGEIFEGSVVLGRKDDSTKPNEVRLKVGGRSLRKDEYEIVDGKVKLNIRMNSPGDYKITGNLIFLESGKSIDVPVNSTFSVIEKPNTAIISAEKMNVVYRGVDNPISVTIPGVPDNKVKASAPGLIRQGSRYILRPGKGREVLIKASGEIDGQTITSQKAFRIKDIPRPVGTIGGQSGEVKLPKDNIKISTVRAKLEDFDFEMKLIVTRFKLSVPGLPSATINGNKFDARSSKLIARARKGDVIQIFDINAVILGNSNYKLKKVTPISIEVK